MSGCDERREERSTVIEHISGFSTTWRVWGSDEISFTGA
jgi:hypothetical protein